MAANDPGLHPVGALGDDPIKGEVEKQRDGSIQEDEPVVAPDQFDERYETSKYEIWSYYSYYIG